MPQIYLTWLKACAHNAAKMFARKVLKTHRSVFIRLGLHIFAGFFLSYEHFTLNDYMLGSFCLPNSRQD
jgi:hypothetical protein